MSHKLYRSPRQS